MTTTVVTMMMIIMTATVTAAFTLPRGRGAGGRPPKLQAAVVVPGQDAAGQQEAAAAGDPAGAAAASSSVQQQQGHQQGPEQRDLTAPGHRTAGAWTHSQQQLQHQRRHTSMRRHTAGSLAAAAALWRLQLSGTASKAVCLQHSSSSSTAGMLSVPTRGQQLPAATERGQGVTDHLVLMPQPPLPPSPLLLLPPQPLQQPVTPLKWTPQKRLLCRMLLGFWSVTAQGSASRV